MKKIDFIDFPSWLIEKVENNDQKLDDLQFKTVNAYYFQLTNQQLQKRCSDCVNDAYIIFRIQLKNQ